MSPSYSAPMLFLHFSYFVLYLIDGMLDLGNVILPCLPDCHLSPDALGAQLFESALESGIVEGCDGKDGWIELHPDFD